MIALTREPINSSALQAMVERPECGGVVLFVGTVRAITAGVATAALHYEAHEPMALAALQAIAVEAQSRWPLGAVAVVHRLGMLQVGEAAVVVACSTPHRADAFAATQWIMDTIKQRVPIWKQEVRPDGSGEWVHPETIP
jgi:molybdopterin synthase catalytic subunit